MSRTSVAYGAKQDGLKGMSDVALNPVWDLDSIFPGGSQSTELVAQMDSVEVDMEALHSDVQGMTTDASPSLWGQIFERLQAVQARLRDVSAFCGCLVSQDTKDAKAKLLSGRAGQMGASLARVTIALDALLTELPDAAWRALLAEPTLAEIGFVIDERRRRAKDRMDPARETLASALSVDGYQAWSRLYQNIVSQMTLPFTHGGITEPLSMGQAANKLMDEDRAVRTSVFREWESTWSNQADLCADTLNHIAGYRLALYKQRGWTEVLHEPLEINRMQAQTLDAMWAAINRHKAPFVDYLRRKAQLLGVEKLSWHDVAAPLPSGSDTFTYDQGADFVVRQFATFSPAMAAFARQAIDSRWVESQDRADKGTGAYCTSFPAAGQTRVFMTFAGTFGNVSTLAHELGHAYHQSVMRGLPVLAQGYAMNVAETASTLAERIVSDAAVRQADSVEERTALLEDKVQQAATMFMNIHARFLFETRLYDRRRHGLVGVDELNALMLAAQKEAFCDALDEYHPHFWASKQHFYNTGVPFYNFPYTFGFLFSNGLYARALEEGPSFADKYVALLRDTGRMRVEDLAQKHLGVDLAKPDFWESAVLLAVQDATEFLELTAKS